MKAKMELIQEIVNLIDKYNDEHYDSFHYSVIWYEKPVDSYPTEVYGWYNGKNTGVVGKKLRETYIHEEDFSEITPEQMEIIRSRCPQVRPSEEVDSL